MNAIDEIVDSFSRLPGIGKKSAARIANSLLNAPSAFMERFSSQILHLQERIRPCSICGAWTERDPCPICSDSLRERSVICVVESAQDVQTIENSHAFRGLYHVLGGVIAPLDGVGPSQLRIAELQQRVVNENIAEVIIATNPTLDGDTTALYIQKLLENNDVKVTRLASGIPAGGDLEYVDRLTLDRSFRGRTSF